MAREFSASAALAVSLWAMTPAEMTAMSGRALISPVPVTTMRRGASSCATAGSARKVRTANAPSVSGFNMAVVGSDAENARLKALPSL